MTTGPSVRRILLPLVVLLALAAALVSGCAGPAAQPAPAATTKSEAKPAATKAEEAAPKVADSKPAKPAEQVSYQGKTINMIVPYGTGGTYDLLGRIAAKLLPKYIPGNPGIVVTNQAGGGGVIGIKAAYESKPDGLTLVHFAGGQVISQFLGQETSVDFPKFEILGSAGGSSYVYVIRKDLGIKTVDDLRKARQTVRLGGLGKGTQMDDVANILKALMGLNQKVVAGYKATPELYLAIKQGELDGITVYSGTLQGLPAAKEQYDAGELDVIYFLGGPKVSGELGKKLGNLPYIGDSMAADDRKVYDAYMNLLWAARPFAAPPGTPAANVRVLRDAFQKMVQDPEFLAESAKISIDVDPVSGEKVVQYFKDLLNLQEPMKTKLTDLLK